MRVKRGLVGWPFGEFVCSNELHEGQREGSHSQGALTRSVDKLALLSQLSRLQNCDQINVHCLSNPDSGVLFGQRKKMISNTPALLKTETI